MATAHAAALADEGCGRDRFGGESTRPKARRVSEQVELHRVLPVITALVRAGFAASADTTRANDFRAALSAGAGMVNDVSGGLADPAMAQVIAEADVPYVVSHRRAHGDVMHQYARYDDVVGAVVDELTARVEALVAAGVRHLPSYATMRTFGQSGWLSVLTKVPAFFPAVAAGGLRRWRGRNVLVTVCAVDLGKSMLTAIFSSDALRWASDVTRPETESGDMA